MTKIILYDDHHHSFKGLKYLPLIFNSIQIELKQIVMKKIGILLMFLVFVLLACSHEDDNDQPLIGTWEASYTELGITVKEVVTFNTNNTGMFTATITYQGTTETESAPFMWSVDGTQLTIIYDDNEIEIVTFSIDGNKLTVTIDGETVVFTRK